MCSSYIAFENAIDSETTSDSDNDCCDLSVVGYNDEDVYDSASDSSDLLPIRKRARRISSTDEEDGIATNTTQGWVWSDIDNESTIHPFLGKPGIASDVLDKLGNKNSSLDMFYQILSGDFWELLSTETNRYHQQVTEKDNYHHKKFEEKWENTTPDEMKAYFALCVIMSQVRKPTIESYWSERSSIETPLFRKTMPFSRFTLLSRYLHFVNDADMNQTDQLRKLQSVVEYLNKKFFEIYTPEENVVIDESLMKFKGRLPYKQFNPSKRARFGIKFYKLCESKSGFCCKFKIYTGQDKLPSSNIPASENVVMELAKFIRHRGYILFLDNWYSSPQLFTNLHSENFNVIGTVRSNRKNMPKDLSSIKLKNGQMASRSARGLLALKWLDRKNVYMLSTVHRKVEMIETNKTRILKAKNYAEERVVKPQCVLEYNMGMGGVDRQDQVLAYFPIMRKYMKGYKKIFFYLTDMALFNSYVLYQQLIKKIGHYTDFRIDVAEQLLSNINLPNYKLRGRPSMGDPPLRLQAKQWGHFPRHIPPTASKAKPSRACKVCAKAGKRSETTWECKSCLVALHVPDCFEKYHSVQNY